MYPISFVVTVDAESLYKTILYYLCAFCPWIVHTFFPLLATTAPLLTTAPGYRLLVLNSNIRTSYCDNHCSILLPLRVWKDERGGGLLSSFYRQVWRVQHSQTPMYAWRPNVNIKCVLSAVWLGDPCGPEGGGGQVLSISALKEESLASCLVPCSASCSVLGGPIVTPASHRQILFVALVRSGLPSAECVEAQVCHAHSTAVWTRFRQSHNK